MANARSEYFHDLLDDVENLNDNPEIISALILNDALNGCRKALLDIAEANRQIAIELSSIKNEVACIAEIADR